MYKDYKTPKQSDEALFFSWECITLELKNGRTIDLVIKDEKEMMRFIKFLILKLKTVDNKVETNVKVKEALIK